MRGYNDVTAQAYAVADNEVGGSPACRQAIGAGHAAISKQFGTAAGRASLAAQFGQTPSWYESIQNQADFAGNVRHNIAVK